MTNPFMRKRPGESPQETGRRFEKFWAAIFGTEPQRGSGSQWFAKLDVADGSILWSLKWTDAESFRVTKDLMREVQQAINGQGGTGGETFPGIATSLGGEAFVTMRAEDFLRLCQSDTMNYITPSKGTQKRARAKIPSLLRDEDEDL